MPDENEIFDALSALADLYGWELSRRDPGPHPGIFIGTWDGNPLGAALTATDTLPTMAAGLDAILNTKGNA